MCVHLSGNCIAGSATHSFGHGKEPYRAKL
jgi:hypothetical protein